MDKRAVRTRPSQGGARPIVQKPPFFPRAMHRALQSTSLLSRGCLGWQVGSVHSTSTLVSRQISGLLNFRSSEHDHHQWWAWAPIPLLPPFLLPRLATG